MKNFWKKTAAGLLALLIVAGASPVMPVTKTAQKAVITASATQAPVTYIDANGDAQSVLDYTEITDQTTWSNGTYVVTADTTISDRVTVSGTVNLILCDGVQLTCGKGITVTGDNTLKIYAQSTGESAGALIATAADNSNFAGIGGGKWQSGGNITISGGTVTANGGESGAGIGGGFKGDGGEITISGGEVTATGGNYGGMNGAGGNITISGGTIEANGGEYGAGIGGGMNGAGGNISISGGEVTATGGNYGASIGGGANGTGGTITINGGNVTANVGNYGAGIGTYGAGCTISLSWTNATDSIHASSYRGTVTIAAGKVFTDGKLTFDSNTSSETLNGLIDATLTPEGALDVTVTASEHGTVTAPAKAFADETVTLTVTPAAGYELKSLTVTDSDNNEITVTDNQFTMPDSDVTITAEFKVLPVFPDDGILTIGKEYAFTPDEDGVYSFNITNATEGQALLIKGSDGVIADIQSAHLKADETYIIRVNALPTIGDPGQAKVTWEKLTSYNISLTDSVENGAIKLYRVKNTALYNTTDTLALAGDEMAIVPTPEEVCDLKELTVTAGGEPLELTEKELVTSEGVIVYYSFTMPAEDVTVTAEFEKPISSASLTLGDDLGLNFYMSSAITDENAGQYTVKFEGECLEDEAPLTKNESTGKYYATAHVYAKNLDKKITAKLYKGEEVICTTEYSVSDYLENAPANVTDAKALALIKATKAFGDISAAYFYADDHDFSTAYNAYLTLSGLDDEDIVNNAKNNYATEFTTDDAKISLVLDSKTAIRLYIQDMQEGTQDDSGKYTSVSGPNSTEDYPSYFEISGLLPQDFAEEQSITVGGKTYKFSALSWANRILNQDNPSEKNVNMAKAVTAYYLAAREYVTVDLSKLEGDYVATNGQILTGELKENVKISVADGATVTLKDVTINGVNEEAYNWAGINCDGNAKLILEGTNTVKGFYQEFSGVYIAPEKTLIIDGTGTLNASSNGYAAGIGGGKDIDCGNIVINGGIINAEGYSFTAAIGGGCRISADHISCGDITINGGTVTAKGLVSYGTKSGCGIGFGDGCIGGKITITGGTVIATADKNAAAIGSTAQISNAFFFGDIIITGGNVIATGGASAAGIGTGSRAKCGDIIITGGTIDVSTGDFGPAIGVADMSAECGDITISGGTVTATGGKASAAIGNGASGGPFGTITITNDVVIVTATKGEGALYAIGEPFMESNKVVIEDSANVEQN